MRRPGRILVVDDDERWLELLSETLEGEGISVDVALTAAQALEFLSENVYHMLVLDISLEDGNKENTEGMNLLERVSKQGLNQFMNVLMLSAYGTRDQMREAFTQYGVVDFRAKDKFDNLEFLSFVQQKLTKDNEKRPINLDLNIHWQDMDGPEQLLLNVEVNGTRIGQDSPMQMTRAVAELEDLLCRLFYDASELIVTPLVPGRSGAGIFRTYPFYVVGGAAQAEVVKFGDFSKIDEEYHNFETHVKRFIRGGRHTAVLNKARTLHFGGIAYSLLGTSTERLEDLGSFYQHNSPSQIAEMLKHLFEMCANWYASREGLKPVNLTSEYEKALGFTMKKLERALAEQFPGVEGKDQLRFRSLAAERVFNNPLLALSTPPKVRATYLATTHGDFNEHNILLDASGNAWLIDFLRTGPSHILRDAAQLDSVIRFHLLAPEEASLEERLKMEEILCSIDHFSQLEQLSNRLQTRNKNLAKAYTTVLHLRAIARGLVSSNPNDDLSEYYIALFYQAINTIRYAWIPTIQREHALISASLLTDRLKTWRHQ
jgi:CheY-like chemotaxis protein